MDPTVIRSITPIRNQSPDAQESVTFLDLRPPDAMQNELRHLLATELSALFAAETSRRDNDWGRTLESVKEALVGLERTCQAASDKLAQNQSTPGAAVWELIEKFVAAARSDREAAVAQTRAEAQTEIARVQDLAGQLQAELRADRDTLKTARVEIDTERGARARAEAACEEARAECKQIASTFEGQLHAIQLELEAERGRLRQLKQQLDAEKADRAKLVAALQAVQRAVSFTEPLGPAPEPAPPVGSWNPREDRQATAGESSTRSEPAPLGSLDDATDRTSKSMPPTNRGLELGDSADASDDQTNPALVAYAEQLLDEIEVIYWTDLKSKRRPADVVDRLVAHLHYARDAFLRRSDSGAEEALSVFDRHVTLRLDTKNETSFARHLAIAAYELATSHDAPTRLSPPKSG